jgi:hypothetical protein
MIQLKIDWNIFLTQLVKRLENDKLIPNDYDVCINTSNLYLNCELFKTKKNHLLKSTSIFNKHNFTGLKGKRQSIEKKNFETPIVTNAQEGANLIQNTFESINQLFIPIPIFISEIDSFFNADSPHTRLVWFKKQYSKNKNKIRSNFCLYILNDRVVVELDPCVYWLNSKLSYLS